MTDHAPVAAALRRGFFFLATPEEPVDVLVAESRQLELAGAQAPVEASEQGSHVEAPSVTTSRMMASHPAAQSTTMSQSSGLITR